MHSWDLTPKQAVALQRELAGRVEREDRLGLVSRVAGWTCRITPQPAGWRRRPSCWTR